MYVSKECTPRVVETALTWTLAQQERDEPIPDPPENDLGELICEYEEFVEPNMLYDLKPWDDCSEHWLDADWYIDTPQGIDESRFQELLGEMVREPSAYLVLRLPTPNTRSTTSGSTRSWTGAKRERN